MTIASSPKQQMDDRDRRLLNEMQDAFPVVPAPFDELAGRIGTDREDVLRRVAALRESGVLRQVSPIFDTKALGYHSSLVAMRVPEERLKTAADVVNAHPGVSHNYRRTHEFNMWLTIAVPPGADLQAHVDALHRLTGAESTRLLPTLRLFKIGVTLDLTGERSMDHRSAPQYTHERRELAASQKLTDRDIDVIRAVQGDLPLEPEPFGAAARQLGVSVEQLIEELVDLQRRGFLRRFAAILRHRKAGFGANGMAVWNIPEDQVVQMGEAMAGYTAISHCYQRPKYEDWKYNLFTMIHARSKAECEQFVSELSEKHQIDDYAVLYSTTEYKKVRLEYFSPAFDEWERRFVHERETLAHG